MGYRGLDDEGFNRCMECGEPIRYGRSDKKFCNCDCKNTYHNRTRHAEDHIRASVISKLKVNYSVLSWMLLGGRSNARLDELILMGFDMAFFTAFRKTGRHREYECYDIAYYMTANKVFNVHRLELVNRTNHYICKENRHGL